MRKGKISLSVVAVDHELVLRVISAVHAALQAEGLLPDNHEITPEHLGNVFEAAGLVVDGDSVVGIGDPEWPVEGES